MRIRKRTPAGHGEVLTDPPYAEWAAIARENAEAARGWDVTVGDVSLRALRDEARREALAEGLEYSDSIGVSTPTGKPGSDVVVMTGHQPELFHPGVWVKHFLLDRLATDLDAVAIDVVVDSDGFDRVELRAPCFTPGVGQCAALLALGSRDGCYACSPPPDAGSIGAFRDAGCGALATLSAPALRRHFARYCDLLEEASATAPDLAAALTGARRRYEEPAGTGYLELPVTRQARTSAFRRVVAHVALDAPAFARVHNAELASFRERTAIRSAAQPFPDLQSLADAVELPLWWLGPYGRRPVWVRLDEPSLAVDGDVVLKLGRTADEAVEALTKADAPLAPRALMLTLFERMVVADLFIHGVGGGRYDQVTDAVIARYFGVEPPRFVVASMTLHLPLGGHSVGDAELRAAEERVHLLKHNPDQLLGEVEFDSAEERTRATALAREKCELVLAIVESGSDRKALGTRIRAVNLELASLMATLTTQAEAELAQLRAQREADDVLTDRTYPFCLWDPLEVADKVR